jgi:O-antigen ligase
MRILRLAEWSLLLLVFSLPLVRPFNVERFGPVIPLTDAIFVLVFALTAGALVTRQLRIPRDPAFLFFGLYAAVMTVATLVADDPTASRLQLLGEFYLIALAACTSLLITPRVVKWIALAWTAATVLTCLAVIAGIILFIAGYRSPLDNYFMFKAGSLPFTVVPRMNGLFSNPNMLCDYLNVSLALVLLSCRKGWLSKNVAFAVIGGICVCSLFTFSPGLGGLALTAGLWGYRTPTHQSRRRMYFLTAGIAGAVLMFAVTLVSPNTTNTDQDLSVPFTNTVVEPSVRVLVWENSLDRVQDHLIIGRGVGADVAEQHYTVLNGEQQLLTDAHNMWLNVLGQEGLLGLAAFAAVVVVIFKRSVRSAGSSEIGRALFCAFAGAFLYQGLTGSFEDARHLWVLIGMIVGVSRLNLKEDVETGSMLTGGG